MIKTVLEQKFPKTQQWNIPQVFVWCIGLILFVLFDEQDHHYRIVQDGIKVIIRYNWLNITVKLTIDENSQK